MGNFKHAWETTLGQAEGRTGWGQAWQGKGTEGMGQEPWAGRRNGARTAHRLGIRVQQAQAGNTAAGGGTRQESTSQVRR